jgi:hypothetical protein
MFDEMPRPPLGRHLPAHLEPCAPHYGNCGSGGKPPRVAPTAEIMNAPLAHPFSQFPQQSTNAPPTWRPSTPAGSPSSTAHSHSILCFLVLLFSFPTIDPPTKQARRILLLQKVCPMHTISHVGCLISRPFNTDPTVCSKIPFPLTPPTGTCCASASAPSPPVPCERRPR